MKQKAIKSYNVGGVSFEGLKVAKTAFSNLSKELASAFTKDNCSPFAFCKWLLKTKTASGVWFLSSVLGVDVNATNAEGVFSALVAAFPLVNKDGKMCKKVVGAKGVFSLVPISVFDSSVLSACAEKYLKGTAQISLPSFGKIGEDGEVSEISEEDYNKAADAAKQQRKDKAAAAKQTIDKYSELVTLATALYNSTKGAKVAAVVEARANLANMLGL